MSLSQQRRRQLSLSKLANASLSTSLPDIQEDEPTLLNTAPQPPEESMEQEARRISLSQKQRRQLSIRKLANASWSTPLPDIQEDECTLSDTSPQPPDESMENFSEIQEEGLRTSETIFQDLNEPAENQEEWLAASEVMSHQSLDETLGNQDLRLGLALKLRPSLPEDVTNEIKRNFFVRKTKQLRERKKLIDGVKKRRELREPLGQLNQNTSPPSTTSKTDDVSKNHFNYEREAESNDNVTRGTYGSICKTDDAPSSKPNTNARNKIQKLLGEDMEKLEMIIQLQNDLYASKMECARLQMDKRGLRSKMVTTDAETSLLRQQVSDLTSETQSLREQLSKRKKQSEKQYENHRKDRIKFDNSTELIAQAKIGLTKALNDASNLEAKIDDLEITVDDRERRLDDLYETIQRQTETIEMMNLKLKDKDTLLRLSDNERQKLEEEVEALISANDGEDTGETLRRLERERETWLWDREQQIEDARRELEDENDRNLEREKFRHRQELDMLTEYADKKKQIEEKQREMKDFVNQQIDDMMDVNHKLQERLANEREDLCLEREEQDETIASLELEIIDLQTQLATQNRDEKELIYLRAAVESTKEELSDALAQNKKLEGIINEHGIKIGTKKKKTSKGKGKKKKSSQKKKSSKDKSSKKKSSKKNLSKKKSSKKTSSKMTSSKKTSSKKTSSKKTPQKNSKLKKSSKKMPKKSSDKNRGKKEAKKSKTFSKKKSKKTRKRRGSSDDSADSLAVLKSVRRHVRNDDTWSSQIPVSIICSRMQ
ncbi:unnamed protein product [Pseudo-nitzschia multistriata]|uniref:Uncharacterized protein n=1 Tax=Pseudo-nitzschia multistriata TaxID=183589 RepID=A0A448ZCK3_9STRA|nr:unnamed protein product [Pseudo-nitzschia multistriata]